MILGHIALSSYPLESSSINTLISQALQIQRPLHSLVAISFVNKISFSLKCLYLIFFYCPVYLAAHRSQLDIKYLYFIIQESPLIEGYVSDEIYEAKFYICYYDLLCMLLSSHQACLGFFCRSLGQDFHFSVSPGGSLPGLASPTVILLVKLSWELSLA